MPPDRRPPPDRPPSRRRTAAEMRSARFLLALHRLPRWAPMLVMAVLLLVGLAVSGVVGAACIGAVAVFLGWLLYLSWPLLPARARALRLLAFGLLVGVALAQLL